MDGSNEGGRTKGHAGPGPGGEADGRARSQAGPHAEPTADLAGLARDWIELWQSEVTALASDPETAETWSRLAALWAGAAASGIAAMPRGARDERHAPFPGPWPTAWPPTWPPTWPAEAPRPAAAAAAPDAGGDAPRRDAGSDDARLLQRVLDRLDAIEQRLADMERAALEQRGRSRTRKADPGQPRRRGR